MRLVLFLINSLLLSGGLEEINAQSKGVVRQEETYRNPVIKGDFADPSIIRVGNEFYATGTSSEFAPHYPIFTSTDLINWEQIGYVFQQKPGWMLSSFWAPELFYHNNTYYVYYTIKRKSDNKSCIGVATTKDLKKGFTDHGIVVEHGTESIDAFVWNDNRQLYISWKAYGLDKRPIEILASKLSADGLKLEGEPFTLLKENSDERGMEGQYLIKKNGYYYLFYSAGGCCGRGCSYNVRVARAKSINEPFVRYDNNPLLDKDNDWMCPGHGTLVETADNRYFYMYHAYNTYDHVYTGRQGMIDELFWDETSGWPHFKHGQSPSIQSKVPFLGTTQKITHELIDSFDALTLSQFWQWDFRSAQPVTKLENGNLYLSGKINPDNKTGTVLTVRPVKGNYEINTEISNINHSSKGLVLYGDANQAVGISVIADKVQVWEVKDKNKFILSEEILNKQVPIYLKIAVENGFLCRFYWSADSKSWKEMKLQNNHQAFYDGSYLPQWDRSARAGLMHNGSESEPASFSFFKIIYK